MEELERESIMMDTVILKYRDFIPDFWMGVKFCRIETDNKVLKKKWKDVEFSKYDEISNEVSKLEDKYKENEIELSKLKDTEKFIFNDIFLFAIFNKEYKDLKKSIKELTKEQVLLREEIKTLNNNKFIKTEKLVRLAKELLKQEGYYVHNISTDNNKCMTTEIWLKESRENI